MQASQPFFKATLHGSAPLRQRQVHKELHLGEPRALVQGMHNPPPHRRQQVLVMHVGCRAVHAGCKGRARHKPGKLLPGPQPGYPPQAVEGDLGPSGLQLLPWPPSALSDPEVLQGCNYREGQRGPPLPPLRVSIQLQLSFGLFQAGSGKLPLRRMLRRDCCSPSSAAHPGFTTCGSGSFRRPLAAEDVDVQVGGDVGAEVGEHVVVQVGGGPWLLCSLLKPSSLLGSCRQRQGPRTTSTTCHPSTSCRPSIGEDVAAEVGGDVDVQVGDVDVEIGC